MTAKFLMTGLAGMVGLGLVAAATPASAEKLSMATPWGGGPLLEVSAKGYAERMKFLTDGEIDIEVFPAGTLGSALKVTNTVRKGVADLGHNWAGYDWGIDRTGVLFGGFAGTMPHEQMMHWYYRGGGLELYNEWRQEKFGVVAMPCGSLPRELFLHSHKRVQTLADYKGLKIRTSGAWAEIAQTLGASTVILAGAEVFPALERKVVDAIEWGSPSMNTTHGFAKVAKYIIVPGIHQPTSFQECIYNKKTYDALSDRNKKLAWAAAEDLNYDLYLKIGHEDVKAFADFLDSGNEVVTLDDEFIAAAKVATDKWADKQGEDNAWFAKIWASQVAYGEAWDRAKGYR